MRISRLIVFSLVVFNALYSIIGLIYGQLFDFRYIISLSGVVSMFDLAIVTASYGLGARFRSSIPGLFLALIAGYLMFGVSLASEIALYGPLSEGVLFGDQLFYTVFGVFFGSMVPSTYYIVELMLLIVFSYAASRTGIQAKARIATRDLFEVSVSVPWAGKTVTLEVAPDHTAGSLVETVASTLNLPKEGRYVLESSGRLIDEGDFAAKLSTLGIKERSKLTLWLR